MFNIASTMSFGPSGSSINAMTTAVPKLVAGLTHGLFTGDLNRHWASLQNYDDPQAGYQFYSVALTTESTNPAPGN